MTPERIAAIRQYGYHRPSLHPSATRLLRLQGASENAGLGAGHHAQGVAAMLKARGVK